MAGIYVHIPFCRQACHYCDFHFSTSLRNKEEMLSALTAEAVARKDFFGTPSPVIETVYFGGGTPSLLSAEEISRLFGTITRLFDVHPSAEVTLEANPEDLSPSLLQALRQGPVNRLSIGIQSFRDEDLSYMHRVHDADTAARALADTLAAGFGDVSVDLIFGTPTLTMEGWRQNVEAVLALPVTHLSCYALTIEPGTALDKLIRKKRKTAVDEEQAAAQFEWLMDRAGEAGFEHYEISNLCRPGHAARHNSSYWKGVPYLGLGPSAHSYDGTARSWNVSHNRRYIESARAGMPEHRMEKLTPADRYNEYVLTALRTAWGVSGDRLAGDHGARFAEHFTGRIMPWIDRELVRQEADNFYLTRKGMLVADRVAADLFMEP